MPYQLLLITLIGLTLLGGCVQKVLAPVTINTAAHHSVSQKENRPETIDPSVIRGVDLSKWQGAVDFTKIKQAGKSYAFIKATLGETVFDPDYNRNIDDARAAGLAAGSYHFYMTDDTPEAQFANFSKHASLRPGDLPPVVDIEILSRNSLPKTATDLKQFLSMMEKHYGVKPILYSGEAFANEFLSGFANYPLWLAEYNQDKTPQLPLDWTRWTFWQYTQNGIVAGVDGMVDLDRFNGSWQQFQELLIR